MLWLCGLIGKICSLLHYKAYFYGLVHDFVIFFSYISYPAVIFISNIRIFLFYLQNKIMVFPKWFVAQLKQLCNIIITFIIIISFVIISTYYYFNMCYFFF